MDTFETIKKFLNDGGKCLLIENGEPIGVVLTIAEYEKLLISEINSKPSKPVEKTIVQEMDYAGVSADLADIEAADDVTLEDLGIDEMTSID